MLVIITIIGTITNYFHANVNNQYQESKEGYNKTNLAVYLLNDLKNKQISIKDKDGQEITGETDTIKITYNTGSYIIYTITDDGIYRNKVKIYNSTDKMSFRVSNDKKKLEILANGVQLKTYTIYSK